MEGLPVLLAQALDPPPEVLEDLKPMDTIIAREIRHHLPLVRMAHLEEVRAGSVCLNSFGAVAKWIMALVMPQPGLSAAR
jgi:hypothetical protein